LEKKEGCSPLIKKNVLFYDESALAFFTTIENAPIPHPTDCELQEMSCVPLNQKFTYSTYFQRKKLAVGLFNQKGSVKCTS